MTDTRPLTEAYQETYEARWKDRRCAYTMASQASRAVEAVLASVALDPECASSPVRVCDVTHAHVKRATTNWYLEGLAPATINKRLGCLSAIGVSVQGLRKRDPLQLKWWLKPQDEDALFNWLKQQGTVYATTADFIKWTTHTGLRVEETLALTWADFSRSPSQGHNVTVPGLKTASAQATLPLCKTAETVLMARKMHRTEGEERVFPISYDVLHGIWQQCRKKLGVLDQPTATLKALRRSAARNLHVTKGMPLDMVRQYLRHEDIETTMGYLRLTGGYGESEMRKWL